MITQISCRAIYFMRQALLVWHLGWLRFVECCLCWYVADLFNFQSWSFRYELLDIVFSTQKGTLDGIHVISIPTTDKTDHLQKFVHWSKACRYSEYVALLREAYGVFPLSVLG